MVVEIDEINPTHVFSPFPNLAQNESQDVACARLIPGDGPKLGGKMKDRIASSEKKPMQTARPLAQEKLIAMPEVHASNPVRNALSFLLPPPLAGSRGSVWPRAILADFMLVGPELAAGRGDAGPAAAAVSAGASFQIRRGLSRISSRRRSPACRLDHTSGLH
jgi:hypothetical protein